MTMEPILLIGGGGHCISCIEVLKSVNKFEIIGILDKQEKVGTTVLNIPVIGTDDDIRVLSSRCKNFLLTMGQIRSAEKRMTLFRSIKASGGKFPVIMGSSAYVSSSAVIDEGTIIMHNVFINANARVGKHCIINTGALVEHEAVIGDFCHISTHAVVNGQAEIGDQSFIGSNAVIANNIVLPKGIIVSAGASILRAPTEPGVYIGNPAIKRSEDER
ncbi:MAG TPA: NeuD/PglB/VioB family sugar acetyltransferase [Bacteroidota bacterium]|nr:NeuD/PglB/VioB family sugar acetyltransferase [Bacteroidota bacterium]